MRRCGLVVFPSGERAKETVRNFSAQLRLYVLQVSHDAVVLLHRGVSHTQSGQLSETTEVIFPQPGGLFARALIREEWSQSMLIKVLRRALIAASSL